MPKLFPVCKCRVADNHRTQKNNKSIDQRLSIRLQLPEAMADDALVAYSIARTAEKGIRWGRKRRHLGDCCPGPRGAGGAAGEQSLFAFWNHCVPGNYSSLHAHADVNYPD